MLKNNVRKLYLICLSLYMILGTRALQTSPFVYVANVTSRDVSVIDAATNSVIKTINLIVEPRFQIAATIDGSMVWVPCWDGATGTVQLIDVATNTLLTAIPLGAPRPNGIVMSPDGLYAYVISYDSGLGVGHLFKINIATKAIESDVSGAFTPLLIFITPDGKTAYINDGSDTILPVDLTTPTPTLAAGLTLTGLSFMAISPDSAYLYASSEPQGLIAQYDIAGSNRLTPVALQTITYPALTDFGPLALVITSDGKTMYLGNGSPNYANDYAIGTIDISNPATPITGTVVTDATISGPITIALTPDGKSLYVVSQLSNMTNVINTSNALVPTFKTSIPVGTTPFALAITPSNFPPTNVSGCKTKNVFLFQTDYINNITWSAPTNGTPASYKIYRDAALTQLVATVSANGPLQYYDHNRNPNVDYSYYITSVDSSGTQSNAVSVTVTNPC